MILYELTRFYDRLLANPDIDICEPGFSKENISFKIVIDKQGRLVNPQKPLTDLRNFDGRTARPVKIVVPKFDGKRTSGIKPYFLWDKTDYLIGVKRDPKISDEVVEIETPKHREEFIKLIGKARKKTGVNNAAIDAVEKFCSIEENVQLLRTSEHWGDFLNSFAVFEVVGCSGNTIFENDEVLAAWKSYYAGLASDGSAQQGLCLVSGLQSALASVHPTIKRGVGGKNDIPLVSCNLDVGESYGKQKNQISPISSQASSKFTAALNYLIDTPRHNLTIADTKTLFWAETNNPFEQFFGEVFDHAPDEGFSADLKAFLDSVRAGKLPDQVKDASRFFVLGLAPNAARISVRFWHVDSIENFARHIGQHFSDLELERQQSKDSEYPSLWQLLIETAPLHKTENIPPNLAGPLMRSILGGAIYPPKLLAVLIGRMRTDAGYKRLNYYRASFIKAILNRNHRKELTMALDHERKDIPYRLGRLFAVLEKIQEDSGGTSLNATIKDRYFATASTNPKVVFPRLISLAQNHFKKLKSDKPGLYVNREKELGQIMEGINVFPAALRLEDQGIFAIGYYHQRQSFFQSHQHI